MHRKMLKQPNVGKRKKGDKDDGTKGKKKDPRGRRNLTVVTVNTNKLKMTSWKLEEDDDSCTEKENQDNGDEEEAASFSE